MERDVASTKITRPLKQFRSHSSLSFSVAIVGDGDGIKGVSAVRGQAYKVSRKSRTQEVGTDYSSVLPLWDQSQRLGHELPLSLICEKHLGGGSENGQMQELIQILRSSNSYVDTLHELRYLCFHPFLLLTSLAFGLLYYCTWPRPPARETIHGQIRQ